MHAIVNNVLLFLCNN